MKLKKRYVLLVVAVITVLGIMSIPNKPTHQWVRIGAGPEDLSTIQYRMMDAYQESNGKREEVKATNPDFTSLILAMQRGAAQRAKVLFPLDHCYGPDIRDGFPSVQCRSVNGSIIYVAGKDNVRETLLSLQRDKRLARVKGTAVALYGSDTPIILVDDPTAKRAGN